MMHMAASNESRVVTNAKNTPPQKELVRKDEQDIELYQWLKGINCEQYYDLLDKKNMNLKKLRTLSDEDFKDLGIPIGDRIKIKNAISTEEVEYTIKIVVIGPPSTGKTSLVQRFVEGKFEANYKSTIGVDFLSKVIKWKPNITVNLQLWDFSGQDRFLSVVPQYYRSAAAALVVFDVTQPKTLDAALQWRAHFLKHMQPDNDTEVPVLLLGNKCDLEHDEMDLDQICKKYKFTKWMHTSAQENVGVTEAIDFTLRCLLENTSTAKKHLVRKLSQDTLDLTKTHTPTEDPKSCGCG